MEYNNLNISQDSFLESFEKIRKSMMPFTKTLGTSTAKILNT